MSTTKGFLVVAENNNYNFVEMAYILAKSIKNTQKEITQVSIIISDIKTIKNKHKKIFHKIIKLPKDIDFSVKSKSKDTTALCASYYNNTPYDETIVLDADFIFTNDISDWWEHLSKQEYDLVFTSNIYTYKNKKINDTYYRKFFLDNDLPNIYTGMFYFKKTQKVKEYFNIVNYIFSDWVEVYNEYINPPSFLSSDVAYSIAYKILNLPDLSFLGVPKFVHMKTRLQDIREIKDNWTELLNVSFQDNTLKIENYAQLLPFHYHDKHFLDIIHEKI